MSRRPGRLAALLVITASVGLGVAASAEAASSPEQRELVSAYAPILMLREQTDDDNCEKTEEQYSPPTRVEAVLGNPAVTLIHHAGRQDAIVRRAPTAAEIAGLDGSYYVDLPRDALRPGCNYAKDYAKLREAGSAPAITYAHIAREPGHAGLAVQYWFFYYFNQFNDIHEGDWEGMQLAFDADTPEQALADGPSQIALFQHGSSENPGGERADWDDTKVQKEGDHPIVYPAAGSHATFYDPAIYVENGRNGSGLGCDDSSQPHTRVEPHPVAVPTTSPPDSEFQWLSYLGHWGQREKGFNNGPTGPVTKRQWLEPFSWMEGVRQDSPKLPGGTVLGPAASTAFCGAVAEVSKFINLKARSTLGALALGLALLLLLAVPPFLTRWRPVDLGSLRHRWAFGQLLRGARQLYGRHWRVFLAIALSGFVLLAAIQGLQYLFEQVSGDNDFTLKVSWFGLDLQFNGTLTGFGYPIGYAVVSGAVLAFLRLGEEGEGAGMRRSYGAMYERLWRVVAGQLLAIALIWLMVFTVLGIPFAIYFYFAWQLIQQEIMFKDRPIREAFRGSHGLARGHWWRIVVVAGILSLLGIVLGPVLGFVLIFLNFSPITVNLIGSIVYALLIPYVAIGRTLLYFDLEARETAAAEPRRRWPSRARPAEST